MIMKRESVRTKVAQRQLFEVLRDTQLGSPLGLAKTGSVVELLQGTTDSKHLKPIGTFTQTGDPAAKPRFQLVATERVTAQENEVFDG